MTAPVSDLDVAAYHDVRPRLFGIAYRVLGSATDAEDVVQDAWLRWQGTDRSEVRDAAAFLATTTTRLAINVIQSAHARRECPSLPSHREAVDPHPDPSAQLEQREALALAVGMLLAKLSPTERAAYVLREAFGYPFREIAAVLSLREANARQLVVRARRRLTGAGGRAVGADEHERFLTAFVAAATSGAFGPFERLLVADCRRIAREGAQAVPAAPDLRLAA